MPVTLPADRLIQSLSTGTYTVTRRRAATYEQGVLTPGFATTLSILASVVPATGRDLMRLPEARRSVETRTVFTVTQLMIQAQGSTYASDQITVDGDQWEVQQLQEWPGEPGFFQAIVQRVGAVQP